MSGEILKWYYLHPVPKPRATRYDRRQRRGYDTYRELIALQRQGFNLPAANIHVVFYVKMPKRWGDYERESMLFQPHEPEGNGPDLDNMIKALWDVHKKNDSKMWDTRMSKFWAMEGRILIMTAPPIQDGSQWWDPRRPSGGQYETGL